MKHNPAKKISTRSTAFFMLLLLISPALAETALAQEATPTEETLRAEESAPLQQLQAVIRNDEAVEVSRPLIFKASQTINPAEEELSYEWDFGDGQTGHGEEIVHTFGNTGTYKIKLTANSSTASSVAEAELFVYEKLTVLMSDDPATEQRIQGLKEFAREQNTHIQVIESFDSPSEFVAEEIFLEKLAENMPVLERAKEIYVWTKGNAGLNALSRFKQKNSVEFSGKTIFAVFEGAFRNIGTIQRQFFIVKPRQMVLVHEAGLFPLLTFEPETTFEAKLNKAGHEYRVINETTGRLQIWNFMSYFLNFLIGQGIPDNTIILLLLLPAIATIIAFMKQVIGVTTLGIYTPSIITLTFLALGLKFGLLAFFVILIVGSLTRQVLRHYRLLFIPKVAIVLTIVALSLFFLLTMSTSLGIFDASFLSLAIFPMLILATLIEKFVVIQSEKGMMPTLLLTFETIGVSILAFFIVGGEIPLGIGTLQFNLVRDLFLNVPELIFVLILINILLGRWTGLRLFEYVRFREVIKHAEE